MLGKDDAAARSLREELRGEGLVLIALPSCGLEVADWLTRMRLFWKKARLIRNLFFPRFPVPHNFINNSQ